MAPLRPMLGDVELQQTQQIEVDQDRDFAVHEVPALEGDFDQPLGRRGAAVTLSGVLTGAQVGDGIKALRKQFRAAQPVSFAADIATATTLDSVLIEEMGLRELAGRPQRFAYAFRLREFTPAPQPETTPPPPPPTPPPPPVDTGVLEVEVVVESEPDFDFSTVTVTLEGVQSDGGALSRTLTTKIAPNIWREEDLPPGQYTARAVVTDPEPMSGAASATLAAGQQTRVQIVLRRGALIATAFVVHFRFDKSFVEPCMRPVLREAMERARAHPDEKVVVVGHTDKTGSGAYNQSLSERRARSVFAFLTSGSDPAAARAEWAELRRPAAGALPTVRDTWGAHQYQYVLQDLGFYAGNVDGKHGPRTDDAVSAFRAAKGLPPGTTVDDAVWDALIDDYLAQDAAEMTLTEDRLLRNAKDGCDGGALRWLGCGEENPLPLPQPTRGDAFRPYRRVEVLLVRAEELPCEPPRPDTFDLPAPGAGGTTWCLGPAGGGVHCCFATRECDKARPGQWCIVPANPATALVSGTFTFEDGTPAPDVRFVIIAPDGEYLARERQSPPDRGDGIVARAGPDGSFSFPPPKGVGIVTVEVREEMVARLRGEPFSAAKGNVVCSRLAADGGSIGVVVTPVGAKAPPVNPTIALGASAVVVRKPHTNPARVAVTLGTDGPFSGSGTLTRSSPAIRFFTAATGGTEITFDGTDNVFRGPQLAGGVQLFAEGAAASAAPDDVVLTLTLSGGVSPVGPAAVATMTSVELTLDICNPRVAAGVDPVPLSAADKVAVGRFLQAADASNVHPRAMLIVRPPNPVVAGTLELRPLNARVRAFPAEVPAPGQVALPDPHPVPIATIPAGGARVFAEGVSVSVAALDTGFRLGLQGVEQDGDRVAATTFVLALTNNTAPFDTAVARVQVEGILDSALASYDLTDLYGDQRSSLFRIRLDAAGVTGATVQARLTSRRSDGVEIESRDLTLNRTAGDRFVAQVPLLAIPEAIPRAAITFKVPQELEVIRCSAGGRLRVELRAPFAAGTGVIEGRVRGRVVSVNANVLSTSGANNAEVNDALRGANRVWAQAGIELRLAGPISNLADPGGLDIIEALPANFFNDLGTERRTLFGLNPNATAIDIYYVNNIVGANGEGFGTNDLFGPMAAFRGDLVIRHGLVALNTLAHELGHILIDLPASVNAGGDDHRLFTLNADGTFVNGAAAPAANMMHGAGIAGRHELTSDQCRRAITNRFVRFVE
jgi:outer membrane protein OmpA-like peptidoglycan-associated protein